MCINVKNKDKIKNEYIRMNTYEIRQLDLLPDYDFDFSDSEDPEIENAWNNEDLDYFIKNDLISWSVNASYKIGEFQINENQNLFDIDVIDTLYDLEILGTDKENYKIYQLWSSDSNGDYVYIEYNKIPVLYINKV